MDDDTARDPNNFSSCKKCVHCNCVNFVPRLRSNPKEIKKIGKKLCRLVGMAVQDFSMIKEGDRVLVAVSGGKDSLTLVHVLQMLQKKSPVKFTVGAVTVDPQTPEYDPSVLKVYFKALGVPYFYESQAILDNAKACMIDSKKASICAYCSRMKRGVLYNACRREGFNVLAMGQHLDDLAESFLMSAFHNGALRTMKAHYTNDTGDLRIIRPLVHVRERLCREYATVADLPIIDENCPACFEAPKERARVKIVLAEQEHLHPALFSSLQKAMKPLVGMENRNAPSGDFGKLDDDGGEGDNTQQLIRLAQGLGGKGASASSTTTTTTTTSTAAAAAAATSASSSSPATKRQKTQT